MAIVPRATGPQVDPTANPNAKFGMPDAQAVNVNMPTPQFATPHLELASRKGITGNPSALSMPQASNEPARELQQFGRDLGGAGDRLAAIQRDMQIQVNATVTDDALNHAKELAARLTYGVDDGKGGRQGGYRNAKGYDAINRASEKGLADEVADNFDEGVNAIAADRLKNDAQRRAFQMQVGSMRAQLYEGASGHVAGEYDNYRSSVYQGRIENGRAAIVADYVNAPALATTLEDQDGAVAASVLNKGLSAEELTAVQRVERSKTVGAVIEAAVTDKKYAYATAVLNTYAKQLDPGYLIKARGLLDGEMQTLAGQQVAHELFNNKVEPAFNPDDRSRLHNLVGFAESGGRETNPDGSTVTSPKGAKGVMQVMPGTNRDPGFGVRPAKDDSPEERARVGRDYLDAMVVRYKGDVQKALAAYNWGPGHLDDALKLHGGDWLKHAPAETVDYVHKISAQLDSGQGTPALPSKSDLYAEIDKRGLDPKAAAVARTEVDRRWAAAEADRKSREEQVVDTALKALDANPAGGYDALPPSLKAALPGDKRDTVRTYAKGLAEGKDTATNPAVYMMLKDPDTLGKLTPQQLYSYRTQLSPSDFQQFAGAYQSLKHPAAGNGPADLNAPALNSALDVRLQSLGINPKPKATQTQDVQRVATINAFVRDATLAAQKQHGKKFTDDEQIAFVDKLFAKNLKFRNMVFGLDTGGGTMNVMTAKASDIPDADYKRVTGALKAKLGRPPSDNEILGAWWRSQYFKGG